MSSSYPLTPKKVEVVSEANMHIKAYILAADPTWIEASVLSYYDIVEDIVVSCDEHHRGWTGAQIPVEDCLTRLKAVDRDKKIRICPGSYMRPGHTPMENDTYQRQCALDQCGSADWLLQLDTDEVLPNPDALLKMLEYAEKQDIPAVEWPMRVLYQTLFNKQFLEVCAVDGSDRFEYPGPIAVRPGVRLVDARRTDGAYLRPIVMGDRQSLQIVHPPIATEQRVETLCGTDAILHNSWARSPASIRSKIASWGHNQGLRSWMYYQFRWKAAPRRWRTMRDFHPFARGLWPALKPCDSLPAFVQAYVDGKSA